MGRKHEEAMRKEIQANRPQDAIKSSNVKPKPPATRIMTDCEVAVCDNCSHECSVDDLNEYQDFWSRAEVGCLMPAGDCPACGAFSYLQNDNAKALRAGQAVLRCLRELGRAHDCLSDAIEDPEGTNDSEYDASVRLLSELTDMFEALKKIGVGV